MFFSCILELIPTALCFSLRRSDGNTACTAMMSLVVKYLRTWEPHWTSVKGCTFLVHPDLLRFCFIFLCWSICSCLLCHQWEIRLYYGCDLLMSQLLIMCLLFFQRTASLSQLPVEDPLPPQWRCYMSPQGQRYYVNTTNNGRSWIQRSYTQPQANHSERSNCKNHRQILRSLKHFLSSLAERKPY